MFSMKTGKEVIERCPQCHKVKYNPKCQYCNENRYLPLGDDVWVDDCGIHHKPEVNKIQEVTGNSSQS